MWWSDFVMWNVVRCGVAISGMVWCGMWLKRKMSLWCVIWRGVECGVLVCGMLHNARCGKVRDVEMCGIVMWLLCSQMWKMMQCVVMSDVVVWCRIKMWWYICVWCCGMIRCEMCCDAECGCGVEWCEMWTVWCGMCFEMWWCQWNGGGRQTAM